MTTLHDFTGTVHPAADLFPMMQTDEFQASRPATWPTN